MITIGLTIGTASIKLIPIPTGNPFFIKLLVIGTIAPDGVFNPLYAESAYDAYPTELLNI